MVRDTLGHPLQSTKPTFDFAHPTVKKEQNIRRGPPGILQEAYIKPKDSALTNILCESFAWSPEWDIATAGLDGPTS